MRGFTQLAWKKKCVGTASINSDPLGTTRIKRSAAQEIVSVGAARITIGESSLKIPFIESNAATVSKSGAIKTPLHEALLGGPASAGDLLNAKKSHLTSELNHLLKLAKNNSAVDLQSLDASIWLVSPGGLYKKNNLASAKIIIVLGIPSSSA